MPALETLGEVVTTDLLVVGGGLAGLGAAIAAKEEAPGLDVLIVEKATTGWAGKAPKGGGHMSVITPDDDPGEYVRFHVRNIGCYLEDQELLSEYARTTMKVIDRFGTWGVPVHRNADGTPRYIKHLGDKFPWGLVGVDLDMCLKLRHTAVMKGVKTIDKVAVVDLLRDGDRVVGAIGFDVVTGACLLVKAKATILANGSQNYRIMPLWSPGRGDGIAAAYRAGAEMRNAEFGGFVNMVFVANRTVAPFAEDYMVNSRDEEISLRYCPTMEREPDITPQAVAGWYRETIAGSGPIRASDQLTNFSYAARWGWNTRVAPRPGQMAFAGRLVEKGAPALRARTPGKEIEPGFIGEGSCVRVDHQMRTTVPGLFAVGDVSFSGSAWAGAVPCPPGRMRGSGLVNAVFSAIKGGTAAAEYVATGMPEPEVQYAQAKALKDAMFAPLARDGGLASIDLVHSIQDVMSPVKYSCFKRQDRMREALDKVLAIQAQIPALKARDTHDLAACNEVRSMAICAEMYFRASLERKESRGWHLREDYPEMDNSNWLKWIILNDENGEMAVSSEDIPIGRYPVKPDQLA